jgi:hypothetical protein
MLALQLTVIVELAEIDRRIMGRPAFWRALINGANALLASS